VRRSRRVCCRALARTSPRSSRPPSTAPDSRTAPWRRCGRRDAGRPCGGLRAVAPERVDVLARSAGGRGVGPPTAGPRARWTDSRASTGWNAARSRGAPRRRAPTRRPKSGAEARVLASVLAARLPEAVAGMSFSERACVGATGASGSSGRALVVALGGTKFLPLDILGVRPGGRATAIARCTQTRSRFPSANGWIAALERAGVFANPSARRAGAGRRARGGGARRRRAAGGRSGVARRRAPISSSSPVRCAAVSTSGTSANCRRRSSDLPASPPESVSRVRRRRTAPRVRRRGQQTRRSGRTRPPRA